MSTDDASVNAHANNADEIFESFLQALGRDGRFNSKDNALSSSEQLELYGLYKVIRGERPANTGFSLTGSAKIAAYQAVSHLTKHQAMLRYIDCVEIKVQEKATVETCQWARTQLLRLGPTTADDDDDEAAHHRTNIIMPEMEQEEEEKQEAKPAAAATARTTTTTAAEEDVTPTKEADVINDEKKSSIDVVGKEEEPTTTTTTIAAHTTATTNTTSSNNKSDYNHTKDNNSATARTTATTTTNTTTQANISLNDDQEEEEEEECDDAKNAAITTAVASSRFCRWRTWFHLPFFLPPPMIPRGRLDISMLELLYAMTACFWARDNNYDAKGQPEQQQPPDNNLLYGLSVRSLFDLYLQAQQFPAGSEIIISPPISIPGMVDVLEQRHHLIVVPVDLPDATTVGINVPGIRKAITDRTVAILLVNVFGNECATLQQRRELATLIQSYNNETKRPHTIDLLEDAAESYNGDLSMVDPAVDVSFVSFGMIKTSTCLAGGVAVFRKNNDDEANNTTVRCQMARLQNTYPVQTRSAYFFRLVKAFFLSIILGSPQLYGILYAIISTLWNFDDVAYYFQRGFATARPTLTELRKRPCPALLQLLRRRRAQSTETAAVVARRVAWAERMDRVLKDNGGDGWERPIFPVNSSCRLRPHGCTHWLYPILAPSADAAKALCHDLCQRQRIDAVARGSLVAVGDDQTVPLATQLMARLLYLPVHLCPDRLHQQSQGVRARLSGKRSAVVELFWTMILLWWCHSLVMWAIQVALGVACVAILAGWTLRRITGRYYVESSTAFAKYCCLFDEDERQKRSPTVDVVASMPQLALPAITTTTTANGVEHHDDDDNDRRPSSVVILTGSTGFLGSMVLRELLLHRTQLGIDRIILLCRSKRGQSAAARIDDLLQSPILSFVTNSEKLALLQIIDVDLTKEDLKGLETNHASILQNVTHVIHCAAAVSFTQTLRDAAISNIAAALNVQQLALRLGKHVKFTHVSTAFIRGKRPADFVHDETLCPFGSFDPLAIFKSMLGTQYLAAKAMHELGFVNTYTFSKSVCEHMLVQNNPEVTIIRPSIVGPALSCPFEGWYGSLPSTLIAAACLFFRFQWNVWSFGPHTVPCIPVDVLARFVTAKALRDASASHPGGEPGVGTGDDTDSFERVSQASICSSETDASSASGVSPLIFNATWDHQSHRASQFLWSEYAAAVAQSGSVLKHYNRITASVALYAATLSVPRLSLSDRQFAALHAALVVMPLDAVEWLLSKLGIVADLKQTRSLSMLPLLFAPFTSSSFKFQSSLLAPSCLDGCRYLSNCVAAADHYIGKVKQTRTNRRLRFYEFAGHDEGNNISAFWWALTQPKGGFLCRLVALGLCFILRFCFDSVTVDVLSFASIQSCGQADRIILAPTHRSFFDFLLLYFLCFAVPELDLKWPSAAAAEEFNDIPVVGWVMKLLGAFFVQRGRSTADPMLVEKISAAERRSLSCPRYLVFIEGTRSRDRRFLEPKTGVLRCLHEDGRTIILPISISYEKIAEQQAFGNESCPGTKSKMSLTGLMRWLTVRQVTLNNQLLTFRFTECCSRQNFAWKSTYRSSSTVESRRRRCGLGSCKPVDSEKTGRCRAFIELSFGSTIIADGHAQRDSA
jgi:alcohol-forming fatty acyl-CoA reductase